VSLPDPKLADEARVRSVFFLVDVSCAELTLLARRFDAGDLVPAVDTVLPLSEVRAAHALLDEPDRRARGKIVLRMRGGHE